MDKFINYVSSIQQNIIQQKNWVIKPQKKMNEH